MLNDYLAALIAQWHNRGLARSALPDAPVQPDLERRNADQDQRTQVPLRATDRVEAQVRSGWPEHARPDRSSWSVSCPCGDWRSSSADRDGVLALCRHLFPQLDQQLDVWEQAHGWLYR